MFCLNLWSYWNWVSCGESWKSLLPIFLMFHRTDSGEFLVCCLLKSHPIIKGRWKKFCCNYFDAKPQFDWTNITPTVYSNRIVSALSLGCGWSHRRQIKGHGNGTWISVSNIPSTTTFSDGPLLPEMCYWNYPNSQCFAYKPGFLGTFCNWFTTRIEWMTENELQTVVSKMN